MAFARGLIVLAAATAFAAPNELERRLREGNWNARIAAVRELETRGAPGLPLLRLAVGDADWQVRMTAVHALGRAGKAAAPDLAAVLESEPCRHVRLTALHWLGSLGPDGEAALRGGLSNESGMVRLMGRYWLAKGGKGSPDAAPADAALAGRENLRGCLPSPAPGRAHWAEAPATAAAPAEEVPQIDEPVITRDPTVLAKDPEELPNAKGLPPRAETERGNVSYAPAERERLKELDALLAPNDATAETLPAAPAGLQRDNPGGGDAAYLADDGKARKPERDPLPALRALLKSPDPAKRARAADDLGKRGEASAPARVELTAALRDHVPRVRAAAALALGNLGQASDPAVPELVRALKRGPEEVEWAAALALGRIGTPKARRAFARYSRSTAGASARSAP